MCGKIADCSVSASTSDIQIGSPVTFSASVSEMQNISSYSFYILKDGEILAKSLRSSDSKMTFTPTEAGEHQLRIYVENTGRQRVANTLIFNAQDGIAQSFSLGFNAKGSLNTKEQTDFFRVKLDELKTNGKSTDKIYIRLQGGTISQKTYPSDWSDDDINN